MSSVLPTFIHAAWLFVGLVWAVTAAAAKRNVRVEPFTSRAGTILTFAVAFALLFSPVIRSGPLGWRVLPFNALLGAGALALTVCGIAFAIWARFHLATNWSASVALKRDHALIRTGPYSIVRHPIYTGLLLAMVGTAIAAGEAGAFYGVTLAFAAWLAKAGLEESFLQSQFDGDYDDYRRRVRMLIPFVL